jgi:hypothetical protein
MKTKQVPISLDPEEKKLLSVESKRLGLSLASFMRMCSLQRVKREAISQTA